MRDIDRRLRKLEGVQRMPAFGTRALPEPVDPATMQAQAEEFHALAMSGTDTIPPHLADFPFDLETWRGFVADMEAAGLADPSIPAGFGRGDCGHNRDERPGGGSPPPG
jgi:hypothetical protein